MKLLVDGVFFSLVQTGIARVWTSLLTRLVAREDLEIAILDRGNCPDIAGLLRIAFPSYNGNSSAADSFLIEHFGEEFGAEAFISTYYTTPVTIPSVLLVHDMIPEVLGFDLTARMWQEKATAICHARRFVCVSANTRADLLNFYPEIPAERVIVAHNGVENSVFREHSEQEIARFKSKHSITKPYFLLVGSRTQHQNYKNATLLFNAVKKMPKENFDILCAGGEPEIERELRADLPFWCETKQLSLSDTDLASAYSGAIALVFPSLYEGFGLPVAEAMACCCPVITTKLGSLGEVAGDAALFVSGKDADEMIAALTKVRNPQDRVALIERGRARVSHFGWDSMAEAIAREATRAAQEGSKPTTAKFYNEWHRLREIQASVDTRY